MNVSDNPLPGARAVHLALAEHLGIEPEDIKAKGFTVKPLTETIVQLEWTGMARLRWDEYRAIVERVQEERRG